MPTRHLSRQVRHAAKKGYQAAVKAYLVALAAGGTPTPPVKPGRAGNPLAGTRS